ncbi:MAG: hypothetical protein OEW16_11015 [Gammaproteobacteria bacterium]|nr:hypothetical protein [Gammaproteobacteria bacterium]
MSAGVRFQNGFAIGVDFLNIGLVGVAVIWLHLLLPSHWPVLVAGVGTLVYRRKIRSRGKFFLMSWILGYGMQGLVSLPWPLVWMMFFDKQETTSNSLPGIAVLYIYLQSVVAVLITLWALHVIATKYWHRLFP